MSINFYRVTAGSLTEGDVLAVGATNYYVQDVEVMGEFVVVTTAAGTIHYYDNETVTVTDAIRPVRA